MGDSTAIAWTDKTWNPWRGCRKITSGCANCYMFTQQYRYGQDPAAVTRCSEAIWRRPYAWQKEAENLGERFRVFTCSWSDFFIEDADRWRRLAWDVIRDTPRLDYQILTKRPERIKDHMPPLHSRYGNRHHPDNFITPNLWLGVSVENRKQGLPRIDILRDIPAAVRFLSIEPLLEDLGEINLDGIDWVIVGGESGPGWRPMDHKWARSIRDQCRAARVPFFFKQSAGRLPERGIELDGEMIREWPQIGKQRCGT